MLRKLLSSFPISYFCPPFLLKFLFLRSPATVHTSTTKLAKCSYSLPHCYILTKLPACWHRERTRMIKHEGGNSGRFQSRATQIPLWTSWSYCLYLLESTWHWVAAQLVTLHSPLAIFLPREKSFFWKVLEKLLYLLN